MKTQDYETQDTRAVIRLVHKTKIQRPPKGLRLAIGNVLSSRAGFDSTVNAAGFSGVRTGPT